jgi:hypothetical protein
MAATEGIVSSGIRLRIVWKNESYLEIYSSEPMVTTYQTTLFYIPEYSNIYITVSYILICSFSTEDSEQNGERY